MKATTGICALCSARLPKAAMARHLASCAPAHDATRGAPSQLFHLRVDGGRPALYWLDLEMRGESPLRALDDLLRNVWLECCGHLSAFEIAGTRYASSVDRTFAFGGDPDERSMGGKVARALATVGPERFSYEYDFGSTTRLSLRAMGTRVGRIGRPAVRLLARNEAPAWPCWACSAPATLVCPSCDDKASSFSCEAHAGNHARHADEESLLPVVNSPRMGVCAYSADA